MIKAEYLIVGQGLAAVMLAFEMDRQNLNFRILASDKKSAASEVAAGMFNPLVFRRLTKSWMADEQLSLMDEVYPNLESKLGKHFYFKKDIIKPISVQEKILWQERKKQPGFSRYIKNILDEPPVSQLCKSVGFGQVTGSGYVDLNLFLSKARNYFDNQNKVISGVLDFSALEIKKDKVQYKEIEAKKIIFCEGYHLIRNPLFQEIKLNPTKGEVLLIRAEGLSENYILNKRVFLLPVGNKHFKAGSTYDWDDLSETPTTKGKESIEERLRHLVTTDYEVVGHKAGIRPAVPDRRPILGFHPVSRNIAVFNGLGTKGVMLAPWFAREMVRLLSSKNYEIAEEVRIERFYT